MNNKFLYQRALACALTFALAFLGSGLRADTVQEFLANPENSGKITFEGATATNDCGELVLKWTDTENPGKLHIDPGLKVQAEILVVGGGGAGGTIKATTATSGNAGGGGGAGEVLLFEDDSKFVLKPDDYQIVIGAGGKAASTNEADMQGESGHPTTIATSSETVYSAAGGGGGGANSVGAAGGSGGGAGGGVSGDSTGGSKIGAGLGNKGGNNTASSTGGAGGGGAGGAGIDAKAAGGGGGAGIETDISGELLFYAAGGGGGKSASAGTGAAGGSGIGGRGAIGGGEAAGSGDENTGSGGGGGGRNSLAGSGGSGIVVLRIVAAFDTQVKLPESKTLTWTGYEQEGVDENSIAYEITSGTTKATKTGTYSFTVKPKEGFTWRDTSDMSERTVTWSIVPVEVEKPVVTPSLSSVPYDGLDHNAGLAPNVGYTFTPESVTNGVHAFVYTYVAKLNNTVDSTNYVWKGVAGYPEKIADFTGTWEITAVRVNPPAVSTPLVYNKQSQVAVRLGEHMRLASDTASTNGTYAATYHCPVVLENEEGHEDYVWSDTGKSDQRDIEWQIVQAPNAITSLSITGWRAGATVNEPKATVSFGTIKYAYSAKKNAPAEEWLVTPPSEEGVWYLKAYVDENPNWAAAEQIVEFLVWDDPSKLFIDHIDITLDGYKGAETLVNFPVAVRLSEAALPGFTYARAGSDGNGLAFILGDLMLDYDVEKWDVNGESLVWVKIPELKADTKLQLWWNLRPEQKTSGPNAAAVWSDYVGVWHMNGTEDSAGNSPSGTLNANAQRATDGLFGDAYGSRTTGKRGPILAAAKNPALDSLSATEGFTVSMWVRPATQSTAWAYLFSRKTTDASDGWGAQFRGTSGNATKIGVYNNGINNDSSTVNVPNGEWTRVDVTYAPTRMTLWINGVSNDKYWTRTGGYALANPTELDFAIGGLIGTAGDGIFNGDIDEVRISKTIPTGETTVTGNVRMGVEIAAATDPSFMAKSLVYHEGLKVNDWVTRPEVQPRTWDLAQGKPTFDVSPGSLREGAVAVRYYSASRPDESLADLSGISEAGTYYAVFEMADSTGYEPISESIEIRVFGHAPVTKIGGMNGDSGRVLLMNRDANMACPVDRQGYSDKSATQQTYWEFLNATESGNAQLNLQNGTESVLYKNGGDRLWHLVNCRHGNTFPSSGDTLLSGQNYLPWYSPTAYRFNNRIYRIAKGAEAGRIVMQNVAGAAVYSKCLGDGVGTIYFDAVNGWTDGATETGANYKLRIEYVTETKTGAVPTDENCDDGVSWYGNLEEMWKPVDSMTLYKRDTADGTGEFEVEQVSGGEFQLAIKNGGTVGNFYRVAAKVAQKDQFKPLRFRILRETAVPSSKYGPDEGGMIVLDNIIVSYPPMYAELYPTGAYDSGNEHKRGATLLGQELATTVPFPGAGEANAFARAKLVVHTNALDAAADPETFISAAKIHYRWRYLGQIVDDWKSIDLDPLNDFVATRPLELPDRAGDVEFWYDATLCAPYYAYVDYSGLDLAKVGVPASEEVTVMTNRLDVAGQPTSGDQWFFRLRNGASAWEGVSVRMTGGTALDGEYPMELMEDDMWRALVPIKKGAEGMCAVQFVGTNRTETGATELSGVSVVFGAETGVTNRVPANGTCVANGAAVAFAIDHNANYYEFRFSTKYMTWSVARAEYQNFNHWHDAYAEADTFRASFPTNGVDDVAMTTLTAEMDGWKLFSGENANWNEPFYLVNSDDPGYPKDTVFSSHATPNSWTANNFSFVSCNLVKKADHAKPTDGGGSGIAVKLLSKGQGSLNFMKDNAPSGLDTVKVNARLGQSVTFNSFSYSARAMFDENYTFFAPATMSQRTPQDGSKDGEMTVGASVSVVGYYFPSTGCYEFRIERVYSDTPIRLALYKWTSDGDCKRLCSMDWSGRYLWDNVNGAGSVQNKYYSLFMSLETSSDRKSTKIICGRSDGVTPSFLGNDLYATHGNGNVQQIGLVYTDTDNPLTFGAYGVTATDCPAEFINPCHYQTPLFGDQVKDLKNTNFGNGQYFDGSSNKLIYPTDATNWVFDRGDLEPYWVVMPGRSEKFTHTYSTNWKGLRTPTGLKQDLELYLQPKAGGAWVKYASKPVTGYAFKELTYPLHLTGKWNLQLRTGSANVDVAIRSVTQTQWQATDVEDILYRSDDFVYTQGVVVENSAKKHEVVLQPSRGVASAPFSVRSPVLQGLGKVSVSYRDVCEGAEIWLQMATNNVENRLTGVNSYNQSVTSVDMGAAEPEGTWVTIAKYTKAELGSSGTKSKYLGYHNQPDRPVTGIFRVFIPPEVVTQAGIVATNATQNVNWGKITITGMTVSDEPGLSDTSWFGYNLRAIGDASDSEQRMYLPDITLADGVGNGMDLALNNSLTGVDAGDRIRAQSYYPSIISPTFKDSPGGGKSGVGTVSFKARLYATRAESLNVGRIVIYGASNSVDGRWDVLQTNEVTSMVFDDFSWESKGPSYKAIKLEVTTLAAKSTTVAPDVARVIIDEVVVGERIQPSLSFKYVRPFRQNLMTATAIEDILSANEQPLAGESWGVQTQLSLQQLTDEIDPDSFRVTFRYYVGDKTWGYENWKNAGSEEVELQQVGEKGDLIFRSVGDRPESLVEPVTEGGTVVQYQVLVTYRDRSGTEYEPVKIESPADWAQPSWYTPVDLNTEHGYSESHPDLYSAYTILDTVSPGRAWINEVNFNDGSAVENGGTAPVENQFIEICVPSGVDMTGWYLRLTDVDERQWVMAAFGDGERLPKMSTRSELNGFAFVLAESPETNLAGGIRDADGNRVESDGVWGVDGISGTADKGTLSFARPFQFELVRPSGVVEHQFVLGGTNTYSKYSWGDMYDSTNYLAKLNANSPSPLRFLAGDDLARLDDKVRLASAGVITGAVDTAAQVTASGRSSIEPGQEDTWTTKLVFTPGAPNQDQDGRLQTIPEEWFIAPNGTNTWVTLKVSGDHLRQVCGGETASVIKFVLPQGVTTNVTYSADPWYELETLTMEGVEVAAHKAQGGVPFTYEIAPTGRTCTVVAEEGLDARLSGKIDLKGPYAPSVVNWLGANWPGRDPDAMKPAYVKELGEDDEEKPMDLLDMYFLDIPPFADESNPAELAADRIWWFRYGITNPHYESVDRTRTYTSVTGPVEVVFHNVLIKAKLYISNDVTKVAYAPKRLQGLDNARSDSFSGRWESETFQVKGNLLNFLDKNEGFLPFRAFTFGEGSFTGATDAEPFTSTIEILDPFSTESPGFGYGWSKWRDRAGFGFKLSITTNTFSGTVELLKADASYK